MTSIGIVGACMVLLMVAVMFALWLQGQLMGLFQNLSLT